MLEEWRHLCTKEVNGSDYTEPISEKQQMSNIYNQGYEDGADNIINGLLYEFKISKPDDGLFDRRK